jgi:hypothetical protein
MKLFATIVFWLTHGPCIAVYLIAGLTALFGACTGEWMPFMALSILAVICGCDCLANADGGFNL